VTTPAHALALFLALCAAGVAAACVLPERRQSTALAWLGSAASLAALVASIDVLLFGGSFELRLWSLMTLGPLTLALDPLSAVFVLTVGLVFLPVSIFSASYMDKYQGKESLRYFSLLYYLFLVSLVFVMVSYDILLFMVAWELMSVLSYLLVSYEHRRTESAHAGFLMLAMSEAGAIAVVLALAILVNASGRLDFPALRSASAALAGAGGLAVFLLSFFGFAVKAGLVPLNSWLPRAHPVAPTNVSALLSGVMVNLGLYGIVRINADLLPIADVGRGLLVLAVGSLSALVGILYATIENDLKRLLAHSTIENMGIITAALGAAFVFMAAGFPAIASIALVAALYHMINHSAYKALLFIGSGSIEAAAGTRDLDRLGGLLQRMPWTGAFYLVGALSIAALPPFNGFVSEWLTLQSILRSAALPSSAVKIGFALCGAALALTAGLAITCFVKAFAMGFLGVARSGPAATASEGRWPLRGSMALLASACVLLGVLPTYVIPILDRAVEPMVHASAAEALVPPFFTVPAGGGDGLSPAFLAEFHDLGAQVGRGALPGRGLVVLHQGGAANPVVFAMSTSYATAMLAALLAIMYAAFRLPTWRRSVRRRPIWAGGLRWLRPQQVYTATGFSNPVRVIFHALLRPATIEDSTEAVASHFRTAIRREYDEVHVVDRWILQPTVAGIRSLASALRRMHIGQVNAYAGYVLLMALLVLLVGRGHDIVLLLATGLGVQIR
jgi:hydrogenase-4 component B